MPDHFRELGRLAFDDVPPALRARVFGVDYVRLDDPRGGTLFVTRLGWPLLEHLCPRMWWDRRQYAEDGRRLREGTGAVYRVPTTSSRGRRADLVVKFSRFAQEVPLAVETQFPDELSEHAADRAHFLSPFEEFGLLAELREAAFGPPRPRIRTKRPLAIYKTPTAYDTWRLARQEWRFYREAARLRQNQAPPRGSEPVELDAAHEYVLLYGWVHGENAAAFARRGLLDPSELRALTARVIRDVRRRGFRVLDQKPAHFILREREPGTLLRDRGGALVYALVDFELLERTPEHDARRRDPAPASAPGPGTVTPVAEATA